MTFEEWWAKQELPEELKEDFRVCWVAANSIGYTNGQSSGWAIGI